MKYSKWIGLLSVITVIIACFTTWAYVPSAHLQIGGMFSNGQQNFGKPGLMNIICSAGAALWFLLPQVWAKRTNIFFCGFNIAWAIRNFILLSRCYLGDCPVRQTGLYVLVVASVIMLLMSLFPDTDVSEE